MGQLPWGLLNNMHVIAVVLDRNARILKCNDFLLTLTGRRSDEVLQRNWFELFTPGEAAGMGARSDRLVDDRLSMLHDESAILTKSGERRLVSWNNAVVRDGAGVAIGTANIGVDVTDRHGLECALLELGTRKQERVARELHDGLAQDLFSVALHAASLATNATRGVSPSAAELSTLARLATGTVGDCRRIAKGLSPLSSIQGGLVEALRQITTLPEPWAGPAVRYELVERTPVMLPLEELDHVYRIAQEALTNALRHSEATDICVRLETTPDIVRLQVRDNGRGSPQRGETLSGTGLKQMQYRADLLQAKLTLRYASPHGTVVSLEVRQGGAPP